MPFCTQCGGQVQPADVFCSGCGARQAGAGAAQGAGKRQGGDFFSTVGPRSASTYCYIPIVGWIMSIIVLASDRFHQDRTTRFHAFQGLYLFVLWLFVDWVFGPLTAYADATRTFGKLLKLTVFGSWIFMLVKTHHGEDFRLPILGELADRSVSEQR